MYPRFSSTEGGRRERAVTEVLGAILVFGLVLAVVALVQVSGIPAANERVEFEHSQFVQQDLQEFGGAVDRVSTTGSGESVAVQAGVNYPNRLLFINPGPVAGTVRLVPADGAVVIKNASAVNSETANYWTGPNDEKTFDTGLFEYRVGYNYYDEGPVSGIEHGVIYDRFETATGGERIVRNSGNIIEGRQITLLTLDGDISSSSSESISLNAIPLSAPMQPISIESSPGSPIEIRLPTNLEADDWNTILASELCVDEEDAAGNLSPNGICDLREDGNQNNDPKGHITGVSVANNELVLTMEEGVTYDLRMARIGVGDEFDSESAYYLTAVEGKGSSITDVQTQRLTVEVRDRYNNPISGVEVPFSLTAGTGAFEVSGTPETDPRPVSNEDGQVTVIFDPDSVQTATIQAGEALPGDGNGVADPYELVSFEVDVTDASGGGGNESGSPNRLQDINTQDELVYLESASYIDTNIVAATFRNTDTSTQRKFTTARLPFVLGTDNPTRANLTDGGSADWGTLNIAQPLKPIGPSGDGITLPAGRTRTIYFVFNEDLEQSPSGNFDAFFVFTAQVTDGIEGEAQTFFITDGLNSGGGQADPITATGATAISKPSATDLSAVEFTLTNDGSGPAVLTGITVNTQQNAATILGETDPSSPGPFTAEVFVDASTDGYVEAGDTGSDDILGESSSFDAVATLDAGSSATITLYEFQKNKGPTDMTGKEITIDLTFGDGTTKSIILSIP
jgi:hypothetical protein